MTNATQTPRHGNLLLREANQTNASNLPRGGKGGSVDGTAAGARENDRRRSSPLVPPSLDLMALQLPMPFGPRHMHRRYGRCGPAEGWATPLWLAFDAITIPVI